VECDRVSLDKHESEGRLRDILKIAAGVVLGLIAYALIGAIFTELNPADRAARDLLERQFAPSS
jgi:hypothetical protein